MSLSNSTVVLELSRHQQNKDSTFDCAKETVDHQLDEEDVESVILLSILCRQGRVGAACYNFQERQLYVYEEFLEIPPTYLATAHLLREINPRFILSIGTIVDEFIRSLRDIISNRSDSTVTSDSVCSLPSNFFLVPSKEYSYEICKSIISQIKLPSIEDEPSEVRRELAMHSLIDFDNRMSVHATGTLVKYLEKNWSYFGMQRDDLKYLHITQISRKNHLLIDNPTFEALQIFSKRGHDASFKRGLPSSAREGLSIYKLFSNNCKSRNGLISLRKTLFNPINDRNILEKRQEFISFILQPCNEEFIASLRDNMREIGGDINEVVSRVGVEIKMKRITQRQKNRANPITNPYSETPVVDYFRTTIYLPFLDFFINQLEERFTNHKDILSGFMNLLSPTSVGTTSQATDSGNQYDKLLDIYLNDIPKIIIKAEIKMWHEHLNKCLEIRNKRQALACLEICSQYAYPNVHKLLKIFCTLTMSTATPERTFSTLKRIKTYLRNTTAQVRLNGLAMLSIHREVVVSVEEIALKPRRLDLIL